MICRERWIPKRVGNDKREEMTFKDVWSGEDCSNVQMFKVERWGKEKGWILRSLRLLQNDRYVSILSHNCSLSIVHCSLSLGVRRDMIVTEELLC